MVSPGNRSAQFSFEFGGGFPVQACVTSGACSWSDAVLADAEGCYERESCEDLRSCLDAAFSVQ